MKNTSKPRNLLPTLILLTLFFIAAQISLAVINIITATSSLFDLAITGSVTEQILHSRIFLMGAAQFLIAHLLVYTVLIGLIWYLTVSISELFSLRERQTQCFGILLTCLCFIWIISANYHFAPHSFFANLMRAQLLNDPLVDTPIRYAFTVTSWALIITLCLTLSNLCFRFASKQNRLRHSMALGIVAVIVIASVDFHSTPNTSSTATVTKPNVIIIGIDALRPDFVGFYNKSVTTTPHLDAILRSGTSFASAYTPLPRTFPSWTGILTSAYPKHSGARGNNTDLSEIKLDSTLPKALREAGYETIFSTDDTRFNNTNEAFGFDHVVTPPMGLNDFIFGTINDLPLSNLIIPTRIGRLLFPYNYANHGTPITYSPDNYLQLLTDALNQPRDKPLFFAVHFTITHWPFYWFNDHLTEVCDTICRYQAGIAMADYQVGRLMATLSANHLLDHAIVIFLSDHGVSLGLHGDRVTSKDHYHGNKALINKLTIAKYAGKPAFSIDFENDYGIDTTHGYGGDVLSLSQYHSVLAFKGYGLDIGKTHAVPERVLLLDVAPTILDLLQLPALADADGISLKSYLFETTSRTTRPDRALFFETSFTLPEIEKEGISPERVLNKSLKLFQMNPDSGLISIKKSAETQMNLNKQEAVLAGDWLLSQYPDTTRQRLTHGTHPAFAVKDEPGFMVLVNLKTGDWTMELNQGFAKTAPVRKLQSQLYAFYGKEIRPLATG